MAVERTLVILKPDAVQRGLTGEIIGRLEQRGLKIVGLDMRMIDRDVAARHYAEHEGKPFYAGLIDYITSSGRADGARRTERRGGDSLHHRQDQSSRGSTGNDPR